MITAKRYKLKYPALLKSIIKMIKLKKHGPTPDLLVKNVILLKWLQELIQIRLFLVIFQNMKKIYPVNRYKIKDMIILRLLRLRLKVLNGFIFTDMGIDGPYLNVIMRN